MEQNQNLTQNNKLETKRILLYLLLTFSMTYAYVIAIIWPLAKTAAQTSSALPEETSSSSATLMLIMAAGMFFPAIGALLTRLITKEGFRNAKLKPNLKGHIRYYLLAWFGTPVFVLLGTAVYFLIFPDRFDPSVQTLIDTAMSQYESMGMDTISESQIRMQFYIQIPLAFLFGPVPNLITCFGEEWGWRGYLLPKMKEKMPMIPMLLVNGIIWGLWHAPFTVIGHNYGTGYWGFPVTGILAMCGFCIVTGVLLTYVSLRADSVWPAVIGHGALNSIGAAGVYFHKGDASPFIGPSPTGIIGGCAFIIAAVVLAYRLTRKGRKNA